MPATRQLVVNALRRTGDAISKAVPRVPAGRWQDFPVRGMSSLREVLQHLIQCEDWWLESIGVERLPEEWFHTPSPACQYEDLRTGADLLHYAAERTYYHDGQIQVLEAALSERGVWLQHQDAAALTPFDARVHELLNTYGLDLTDVETTHANARGDGPRAGRGAREAPRRGLRPCEGG